MFPTRHTATHIPFAGVGEDQLGNDVIRFGDPTPVKVFGWSVHHRETLDGHTSRDIADLDLALPPREVRLQDRWIVAGEAYETVEIRDRTKGFHGWRPGIVVELKRVSG